jgi:hypothetical protein
MLPMPFRLGLEIRKPFLFSLPLPPNQQISGFGAFGRWEDKPAD